jgi:hypothetical protein
MFETDFFRSIADKNYKFEQPQYMYPPQPQPQPQPVAQPQQPPNTIPIPIPAQLQPLARQVAPYVPIVKQVAAPYVPIVKQVVVPYVMRQEPNNEQSFFQAVANGNWRKFNK